MLGKVLFQKRRNKYKLGKFNTHFSNGFERKKIVKQKLKKSEYKLKKTIFISIWLCNFNFDS